MFDFNFFGLFDDKGEDGDPDRPIYCLIWALIIAVFLVLFLVFLPLLNNYINSLPQ